MNNKTLRTEFTKNQYVILVETDGVEKYIYQEDLLENMTSITL